MSTKLVVQNLDATADKHTLESMFSMVGNVLSAEVQIIPGAHGDRRIGFVQMETEEQARDGIEHFNGKLQEGLILIVREDKPHVPDPNFVKPKRPQPVFWPKKTKKPLQ